MPNSDAKSIGDYQIIDLIDRGAQATVYHARYIGEDTEGLIHGSEVALKRLHGEDQYFLRQAEFSEMLLHPNIVRYIDHFHEDSIEELPCIIMEYLKGKTLKQVINTKGQPCGLEWDLVKEILHQCLEGLIFARKNDIIHRDIKPSNIFLTHEGHTKIIDFGVVRRVSIDSTTVGFRGTMDYMAPDFVIEDDFSGDECSDIFSLGVCFFEALTGDPPFEKLGANSEFEFINRWKDQDLPAFSPSQWVRARRKKDRDRSQKLEELRLVLNGFSDFLKRVLSPDRKHRFRSFEEMQRALLSIDYVEIQGTANNYQFTGLLGVGGFGRVYKARLSANHAQKLAIKHLLNSNNAPRFRREAELMQKLPHPNIVSCIEFIEKTRHGDENMYLVMELLPGMPGSCLRERHNAFRENHASMPIMEALTLYTGLLKGLEHLHRNGVLHRDIKPTNLFAPEGQPENGKLLDLGIARDPGSTMTKGGAPGTLDYMAPEFAIVNDFKGSPGSDIYSLGLSLYECLNGKAAFPRLSTSTEPVEVAFYRRAKTMPEATFHAPIWKEYPNLKRLVKRSIDPRASKRYQDASAMLTDIEKLLEDPSKTIRVPPDETTTIGGGTKTIRMPAGAKKPKQQKPQRSPANRSSVKQPPKRKPKREDTRHYPPKPRASNQGPRPANALLNPARSISSSGNTKLIASLLSVLLVGILLVAFTFQFMQNRKTNRCVNALAKAQTSIRLLSRQTALDTRYLKQYLNTRLDMQFGVISCGKLDWSSVLHNLQVAAKDIPEKLRTQTIEAILSDSSQSIDEMHNLWNSLNRYGEVQEFGLTVEAWNAEKNQAARSRAYQKYVALLQQEDLNAQTNLSIDTLIKTDELYASATAFIREDWSLVYAPVRNQGDAMEKATQGYIDRVDTMFKSYIIQIGTTAVEKNRKGEPVINEYQAITDPKLMTTTIGRESTAFREQREKIEKLIKGLLTNSNNF